ncbi:MAG: hypothetical protein CSA38_03205 [Flavobacteriales bacterium]|nr:MAG: hypothetical protein CSA38_03205 [Flavobacteriales bacterium]
MRIEWRDKALEELQGIYDYIYIKSPQNAENMLNEILALAESLVDFPFKFPKEPYYNQDNTRFAIKWSYKMIYRVEKERIIIVRVFDCRQNPNKLQK